MPHGGSPPPLSPHSAVVDIELTSRCNASCSFCPRAETPHQGLIDEDTFTAALGRAVEYRDALIELSASHPGYFETPGGTIWLSFCGMGEPLLHPRVVEYVGRAAAAGLRPILNTNAALLSPERAEELMDAGLAMAFLNVGETGDDYEAVYGLPFERTRTNVEHFLEAATGRCAAVIVLVDHRGDPQHAASMHDYWSQRGATGFMPFSLVNRAGSLAPGDGDDAWHAFRDEARRVLDAAGDASRCWVPYLYPFIGYDGTYYLCSSDWRKEVDLGTVFERALVDLLDDKAERVCASSAICRDCTHEPTNAMARALALADVPGGRPLGSAAPPDAGPDWLLDALDHYAGLAAIMRAEMPRSSISEPTSNRRLIPVRSC